MEEPNKNKEFTFPNDIEYLVFDRRQNEETEFRKYYKKEINNILGHINNIRLIQKIFYLSEPKTTSSIFEEISLVNKSIDFIASSLILLSHGSILESLTLLRMSIESSCSALLIHFNENERDHFYSNNIRKFKSSKAISYAKKKVKYVGELYGILSNAAVHVNKISFGPKIVHKEDGGKAILNIEPFYLEESIKNKKAFLLLIYLVTFITERINEIITIEEMDNRIITGKKEYQYLSCSEGSIEKIYNEFRKLILDYT
jgi:hypothetical protein